ncbi:MAG TPA: response regulator transcription factor [Dehalococcoidia bacterium]|nr:response regulator transcription factor [Dehalococcoidia bacterium]
MARRMRVLLADDHPIVRDGLKAILEAEPDIEVVGEAASGQEAAEMVGRLKPDIIIMDLAMPGMSGIEATRHIKQQNPDIKIMALTMHDSDEYFFQVINAGASGYFVKGGSSADLVSALRTVGQGDVFLYPSMAKKLVSDYLSRVRTGKDKDKGTIEGLTEREREVMRLLAEGRSNQEIADLLVLSVSTVQTHSAHILAKLGLHSRTELVRFAIRQGIISLDP